MSFAPYQDAPPESERALSPSPEGARSPRRSFSPKPSGPVNAARITSPRHYDPTAPHGAGAASQQPLRDPSYFADDDNVVADVEQGQESYQQQTQQHLPGGGFRRGFGGAGRPGVDLFETRLGIRMDWEACLAYLLLPPAGGVMLLVLEHKSDYVRFHAWQSSLLFTVVFIVHIIFSWTAIISWMLFACDILLIGYLTFRAYSDADTLDRCEVPFFGALASQILDDE